MCVVVVPLFFCYFLFHVFNVFGFGYIFVGLSLTPASLCVMCIPVLRAEKYTLRNEPRTPIPELPEEAHHPAPILCHPNERRKSSPMPHRYSTALKGAPLAPTDLLVHEGLMAGVAAWTTRGVGGLKGSASTETLRGLSFSLLRRPMAAFWRMRRSRFWCCRCSGSGISGASMEASETPHHCCLRPCCPALHPQRRRRCYCATCALG